MNIVLSGDNRHLIKPLKDILESFDLLNKNVKIKIQENFIIIPTFLSSDDNIEKYLFDKTKNQDKNNELILKNLDVISYVSSESEHNDIGVSYKNGSGSSLTLIIQDIIKELDPTISNDMINKLILSSPKRYSIYPPLILFPHDTLDYIMRRPFNILPLYGDFGPIINEQRLEFPTNEDFTNEFWCSCIQNGIYQTWAPRFTMFSRGNIKEKIRILNNFNKIENNICIDLYAGIGYFTLCYLKKNARQLFCWELNPWSIEGLIRGLKKNGYTYKLIERKDSLTKIDPKIKVYIFKESNEFAFERFFKLNEKFPISHINLGLLPSSKKSWPISLKIIKFFSNIDSTFIHIHENVESKELNKFMEITKHELELMCNNNVIGDSSETSVTQDTSDIGDTNVTEDMSRIQVDATHLEKIKTFAPDVYHICADFKISKSA
ncbi:hypothetical protein PACTADRAFT_76491 [Pachysolen tannophilus NRRL Y-2460]|uniref:tRNA wybutosine-synthesizing protein 2 n=1 Tax=Pachysolen tannophilus NRRL Y-2460 TaxID=669874 RepID=A0A1E4TT29_PACTA|nr:hypothetical protein PACTADRAFT_76491 [Pachysolen tannophilus NRRL Y-2460]